MLPDSIPSSIWDEFNPLPFVLSLSKRHFEEIGFLPAPRLERYQASGQLWTEFENGELCGFLVWGNGWPILRVYQVCIQYDAQRRLHGAALIARLIKKAEDEGYESISCWVADDIPANDFWRTMGFILRGTRIGGKARGRIHNAWVYDCEKPRQLLLYAS
jgi:GNAT superfamily N-acetyltransferase